MLDLYYNLDDGNTSKNSNDDDNNINNNELNQQNNNANINYNSNTNVNNNINNNTMGGTNNNNNNDCIINEINAKFSKIFPTVNYISIDSKQSYIDIIKSLNYYDEKQCYNFLKFILYNKGFNDNLLNIITDSKNLYSITKTKTTK